MRRRNPSFLVTQPAILYKLIWNNIVSLFYKKIKCSILLNMSEIAETNTGIKRKPGAFEKRIHEIDFIRGVLILLVLMDHFLWCLKAYNYGWMVSAEQAGHASGFYRFIYNVANFYWNGGMVWKDRQAVFNISFLHIYQENLFDFREFVRFFALFGFCFISGISSAFSRNNWVRAGQMLLVYAVIAVGSNLLDASGLLDQTTRIDFNVIGVLAFSTLFYCFLQKRSWKGLVAATLAIFLMTSYVIPWLKSTPMGNAYAPALWDPSENGVFQADWMPLFPFMLMFFMGTIVSYFVYAPTKKSLIPHRGEWERPFCFVGRHTLWIYLGHQVVLIPIFLFLGLFLGK